MVYCVCHCVGDGFVFVWPLVPGLDQHPFSAVGASAPAAIPFRAGFYVIEPTHGCPAGPDSHRFTISGLEVELGGSYCGELGWTDISPCWGQLGAQSNNTLAHGYSW